MRLAIFSLAIAALAEPNTVAMIEVPGEARKYWPRWRGPSGQGLVDGKGYVDKWSGTENVLWKVEVPGRGASSPIVWGDRIFLTSAFEDGARRSILCFRRSDGKLLWEAAAPQADIERIYRKNTFASGTPSTDGERVYAWFGNADCSRSTSTASRCGPAASRPSRSTTVAPARRSFTRTA